MSTILVLDKYKFDAGYPNLYCFQDVISRNCDRIGILSAQTQFINQNVYL